MPVWADFVLGQLLGAAPLLSLLLAWWAVGRAAEGAARHFGLARGDIAALTASAVVPALLVARLTIALPQRDVILAHPLDLLRITGEGQLSLRGMIVGAGAGLLLFGRRARLPLARVADLYGMVAPLGFAVFGLGCLVRDDCFGDVAPPPFGIVFPGMTLPRYPVELYAAVAALLAYTGLQWVARWHAPPGNLALLAIAGLALIQAALEPLRITTTHQAITVDQAIALGLAVFALVVIEARSLRRAVRAGRAARSSDAIPLAADEGHAL